MANQPKSVLIVDDHPVLREGLIAILRDEPGLVVVGEAGTADDALRLHQELRPDLILMDLRLPDKSGAEATAQILHADPGACIIVFSSYSGDEDIYRCLQAGARAYLLKDMLRTELLVAIHTALAGRRYLPRAVRQRLRERQGTKSLTPRELEILRLIAKGLRNREIARVLGSSEGTIRIHISNILHKLKATDRTEAAVQAIARGIIPLE
jgi:two-component system NarL family response regulator